MLLTLLLKCVLIGFGMAAPIGPISMLLIKKTLDHGLKAGAMATVGAATANAVYCSIGGVAIAGVTAFIQQHHFALRMLGKSVIACMLLNECRFRPSNHKPITLTSSDHFTLSAQVFLLTMANPVTILTMSGIFLAYHIQFNGLTEILIATIGVFLGSFLWDLGLTGLTAFAKQYMTVGLITGIQILSLVMLAALVIFL